MVSKTKNQQKKESRKQTRLNLEPAALRRLEEIAAAEGTTIHGAANAAIMAYKPEPVSPDSKIKKLEQLVEDFWEQRGAMAKYTKRIRGGRPEPDVYSFVIGEICSCTRYTVSEAAKLVMARRPTTYTAWWV